MGRSGLVELNIGGKPYTTTRQTLENSGFARVDVGEFRRAARRAGPDFVDRDATQAFDTMLTFLRGALGRTALDRMDLTTRAELVAEAEFYDVPALIEGAVLPPVGALVRYSLCGNQPVRRLHHRAGVDRGAATARAQGRLATLYLSGVLLLTAREHALRRGCCDNGQSRSIAKASSR